MTTLTISRLRQRCALPADVDAVEVGRVTAQLPAMIDEAVAAWCPPDGHLCVRTVRCAIEVRRAELADPTAVARRWATQLVGSLEAAVALNERGSRRWEAFPATGAGDEVGDGEMIWYPDTAAAVGEAVRLIASGDVARRWAWEQVGVVRAEDPVAPPALLLVVMSRHRAVAPGALRWLAARHPSVVSTWTWAGWEQLAHAVGTSARRAHRAGSPAADQFGEHDTLVARIGAEPLARAAAAAAAQSGARSDADTESAVAALLALTLLGRSDDTTVAAAVAVLRTTESERPNVPPPSSLSATERTEGDRTGDPDHDAADEVERLGAPTRFGGLLFVLCLLADIDDRRNWSQDALDHRLAMRLTGAETDDPAVLAFCGRLPDEAPPGADSPRSWQEVGDPVLRNPVPNVDGRAKEEPADLDGLEELDGLEDLDGLVGDVATAMRVRLGDRLARLSVPAADDVSLLDWLIRRDATIHGDPGWIDVRLALDDVDVDIRSAGLDLDPGWVPWLRCVVRFTYV